MNKNLIRSLQTYLPRLQDLRFSIQRFYRYLFQKTHEEDFNAIRILNFPKSATFLDIGSNRGEAIQSMLMKGPKDVKIIAFEPNPLIFKKLQLLYKKNSKVILNNYGLGTENISLNLYVPYYRKWMFDGLASFKYDEAADWLKNRIWNFKETNLTIKKVQCNIQKLDDLKLKADFIKIDVQGFELEVLQGGRKTINKYKPIILIESLSESMIEFLKPMDYNFYSYENGDFELGLGKLNTFCIPINKYQKSI